jgi:cytochrome c oxidase assembly protein subunit 15
MLIGFQGALGWWMVASGLETRTDVSHFRLSAHLLTALLILAGLVWTALDLKALARDPAARPARLTGLSIAVALVLFVQLLFGAWIAGLNAGLAASDWPLMSGRFFPTETLGTNFWHNLVNDPHLLHWVHRWWAFVAVAAFVVLARRAKAAGNRPASIALHTAFGVQILLGIATVMTQVNIVVAVLHQATGALVVASTVWCMHAVGKR